MGGFFFLLMVLAVVSAAILLAADAGGRRRQAAELESEIIKVRPIPDMVHGLMHRKVRGTTKGRGHGKRLRAQTLRREFDFKLSQERVERH